MSTYSPLKGEYCDVLPIGTPTGTGAYHGGGMESNDSPLPPQWSAPLIAAVLTLAGRMRRAAKRHLGSHRPGTPIPRPAIAAVAKEWHAAVDQAAPEIAGHLDTTLDGRAIPADPTAPDLLAGYREAIDRAATEQWPSPEAVMARGAMIARGEPRLLELAILHAHGDATGAGLHREAMPGACRRCAALEGDYPPPVPVDAYWTHPNCLTAGHIVGGPAATASFDRAYAGDVVAIRTTGGHRLTATPNHPVLTSQGWIAAGLLREGDSLICGTFRDGVLPGLSPDDQQVPALIQDVAATLNGAGTVTARSVPVTPVDFHGDSAYGDVRVVRADRQLGGIRRPPILQPPGQQEFGGRCPDHGGLTGGGGGTHALETLPRPTDGGVGRFDSGALALIRAAGLPQPHGVGEGTPLNPALSEDAGDHTTTNPQIAGDAQLAFAGTISADRVLSVDRYPFHGHVYNLQTATGWYISSERVDATASVASGVIVHNCFCVFTIVDAPDDPGDGGPMAATESAPKYEHGSTQLDLPPYLADKVRAVGASIPDDHLAADGREQDPHATVAYGLTDTSDAAIGKVRAAAAGHPPVKLTLGKTSIFAGKDNGKPYDVVKADLHAPGMRTLRAAVRAATPVKDSQVSYQPHVTIAYVKAGLGRHYVDRSDLEGQSITLHRLVHSDRQGKKTIHPLKGASRTATEPNRFGEAGYPDGHWYTIHGAHVFISGGGGLASGGAAEHAYAGHDGVITKGPAGMLGQSVAGLRANGHQIDRHLNGAMPAGADVGAHTLDGHAVDFQRQAHDIGKLAIAHAEAYNAGHAALKRDPNAIKTANEAYKHDLNNLPAHQRNALHQAYDQAQLSHGLTDLRETPKKLDQYGINARDRRAVAEAHHELTLDHYQAMRAADRQRMVMEARGQINGAVRDGHISEERASQLIGSLNAKRDRSLPGMLGSYRYEPTEVPATLQHETKGLARTAPIVAVKTAQVPLLVHEIPKLERPAPPVAPRREDTLARMRAITDGTHTTAYDRKESHQALDHLERAYATYGRSVGQGSINDASKGVAIAQEIGERRSRSGTGNEGETAYGHALKHLANGDTLSAEPHLKRAEAAHAAATAPKPEPAAAPAAPKPAPAAPASGKTRPTFGGMPAESAPVARGGDTGTQGTLGKIDPAGGSKARPTFGGAPVEAPMGKASLGGVLDGQIGMGITTEAPGELFGRTEPGRAQVAGFGYTPRGGAPAGGTTARPRPTFGGAPTETATPPTGPKEAMLNKAHQDAQAALDRHLNTSSFDPLAHMQRTAELKATVDRLAGQLGDIRGTSARSKVQPGDTVKIGGRDHVVTAVAGDRITTNRGTHDRSAITDVVAKTASMFVESRRFSGAAGGGHWLTIEEDGVETHIFLGGGGAGGGVVTKGPAHLIGAHIGHLPPLPGRVVTHHPVGHEPAGAKDHPHYTEHVPPERKPGKPFAREHGAAQTRQAQGPESIPHNQLEARYRAARDAKAKAMGKTEAAPAPTDRGGKTEAAPHEAPTHEHYPILSAHAAGTIDQLHARLAGHLDGDPNVNYPAGMASAMLSKAGQAEHARLVNAVNEGHVPYGGAHDQLLHATGDSHAVAAHDDHLAKLGGLDNINHNVPHIDALIAKHVDGGSLQTDSGRTSGRIETPEEARAVRVPTLDALQAHKAELQAKLDNGKGGADTYHSIQDVNAQIEKHYPAANRPASDAPLAAQADYHGRVAAAHATALSAHDANGTDPTATYAAIERHGNSLTPDHQEAYSAALSAAQDHIDAHGAGHDGTRAMASHAAQEALTGKHDGPLSQDETQALAHRAAAAALGREYTMRTGLAHPDVHLTHEQNLDTIKRRSGRVYYEAAHTAATEAATRANFVDDPNHVARVYNAASMAGHGSGARIEPGVAAHQVDTLHGTNSDAAQAIGRHAASNAIAVHDHQFHDPSLESHFDAHNTAAATDPNTEHFLATELRSGEAKAAYTRAYNAVQAHLAEHLKAGDRAVDHARPLYKLGESEAANHLYRDARAAKRADPNYKAPVRKARAEAEPAGPIADHGFTYPDHHQANAADAGEIARRASASAQLQANGDRHGDALHATHLANYGGAHRAAYLEAHQAATEYTGRMGRRGGQLTDTQRDIRGRKAEDAARRVLGGYAQIAATEADMQDYSEPTTGDVHQDGPMGGEAPAGGTGAKHMLSRLMARIKGSMGKGYLTAEEYDQHARHALGHAGGMASAVARAAGEGDPYRYDESDGGSGDMDAGGSDDGDDTPQAGAGMGMLCANCTRHREGDCICAGCAANDGSECACEHIRQTERQDVRMAEASGLTSGGGERFRLFMPVSMAEAPDWIPYLPKPGTFRHPRYGEIAISADRNRDFVQKFNQGVYQHQIPLDAEHETKLSGAMGWINQLRTNEDGSADARVAWTDRGRSMLDQQRFKFISPEWYDKWEDPATGKTISNVAIGGALTTRPYFKAGSLRPLVASEIGRYYLPDEMTTDLDSRLEEDSMQFAEMETEMQRFREESESYRALAEQNAADALRANERVAALESVARRQRFSEEAAGFIGAGVPEHVAFMETLDDSQREFYGRNQRAIAEQAKTSGLYTEIGVTGSTANNTAEAELAGKARSFREANPAMSAAKAMEAALKADPQLYARYNRESAN